jgi:tetratricopeptide (TPR) repeat protein
MKKIFLFVLVCFLFSALFAQTTSKQYFDLGEKCPYDSISTPIAIGYYSKAIELDSNCTECYLRRAWRKHDNDAFGALNDYVEALWMDANCFKCYNGIADYYCDVENNYDKARENYYHALKVIKCESDQDYIEQSAIIQNIGMTYFLELGEDDIGRKKDREIRLALWDSLISENPLTQYYQKRAQLRSDDLIRDTKGALEDYLIVFDKTPHFGSDICWSIAYCYSSLGNYFQAIQYYNKVIELRPKEYKNIPASSKLDAIYKNRGDCKMKLDDYRGAIEDYKSAIALHPKPDPKIIYYFNYQGIIPLYNSLAKARLMLDDYQNALTDLNKCLSLVAMNGKEQDADSDLADTYFLLGFSKIYLKNKDGACNAWSKSGELGNPNAYDQIKKYCK